MNHLQISYGHTVDLITHNLSGLPAHVPRKIRDPFLLWSRNMKSYFIVTGPKRLQRRFGHLIAGKLHNFLHWARPNTVSTSTLSDLHRIVCTRLLCQLEAPWPYRFKVLLLDEKRFNRSIYVKILTLEKKPVSHIVNDATR